MPGAVSDDRAMPRKPLDSLPAYLHEQQSSAGSEQGPRTNGVFMLKDQTCPCTWDMQLMLYSCHLSTKEPISLHLVVCMIITTLGENGWLPTGTNRDHHDITVCS